MKKILDALAEYLEQEIEEGTPSVVVAPAVLNVLAGRTGAGSPAPAAVARGTPLPAPLPPVAPAPPPAAPPVTVSAAERATRERALSAVAKEVAVCKRCPLHAGRTRTVPGQGNPCPEIVFVGEGPGADEDEQGLAFVGRAGKLLTQMIEAMGLSRDEVFICNVVKCRPPGNRTPEPAEMAACLPYLRRQLEALKPRAIVALGGTALAGLVELPPGMGITRMRGRWLRFGETDLMPTFHPSYLLRIQSAKLQAWEDLKEVLRRLGKPIPEPRRKK